MEEREYCDNVTVELAGWKAKVDDVVRKLDHISTGDKEKIVPEVNELHMIVDELSDRIEGLRIACMMNWKPEEEEGHEVVWPRQFDDSWDTISQSDIGG